MPYFVDRYKGEVIFSDHRSKGPYRWNRQTFETMRQACKVIDKFLKELDGHYWPYQ